jgi:hypothetical protein
MDETLKGLVALVGAADVETRCAALLVLTQLGRTEEGVVKAVRAAMRELDGSELLERHDPALEVLRDLSAGAMPLADRLRRERALDPEELAEGTPLCYMRPMIQGSCLCGGVRFEIERAVGPFELCHCRRCRKGSGAAFAALVGVRTADYRLLDGRDLIASYDAPLLEAPPPYRTYFCRRCGSPVPEPAPAGAWFEIPAGLLDADPGVRPDKHIFVELRAPWFDIRDSLPRFSKEELIALRRGQASADVPEKAAPALTTGERTAGEPVASRPHMPGYGILDADGGGGLLPWSWAVERLEKAHNYWVSTSAADGRPHAAAVWGVWLDGVYYFSTGEQSRKARNLAARPQCVVTTERAAEAVIVEGKASPVRDPQLLARLCRVYGAKYDWDMDPGQSFFLAVRPQRAFGFIEAAGEFARTATRWVFAAEGVDSPPRR